MMEIYHQETVHREESLSVFHTICLDVLCCVIKGPTPKGRLDVTWQHEVLWVEVWVGR